MEDTAQPRRARRILWLVPVLVVAAVAVAVVALTSGGGKQAVVVRALWYGTAANGRIAGGVTPVDVRAVADDPKTPLSVDVRGLRAAGAGPMWSAATAVAGVQAVLIAGVDPRLQQLRYALHTAIDGASAGALLSAGSLAALRGSRIAKTASMTGTVLPDGSVGPVTGIAEKLRAAAAAGIKRILIPTTFRLVADPRTQREVDPVRLGRSLGVEVIPVKSVPDAYALLSGTPLRSAARPAPPIRPALLQMLTRRSRALTAAARRRRTELGGGPGAAKSRADMAALVRSAQQALARHDPVFAFAASAEAAQIGQREAAVAQLDTAAEHVPLPVLAARIGRSAQRSLAAIERQVRRTAEMHVTRVAQLTALADTLSWGAFAMTSMRVAQQRLKTARTKAQLEQIVRFLETGRFEAATYMPACAESVTMIGRRPITRRTIGLLNAYTELIDYASNANRIYADSLGVDVSASSYLRQLLEEADGTHHASSPALRNLRGPTARPVLGMSVALLEYVESTQLVNDLTYRNGATTGAPPNLAPIKDRAVVRTQAQTADAIARQQVREIYANGVDPAFVQWNSRWGADLAFGRLPNTTGEQTLHGLQFQWFAVLQARLLRALERS
jgi:hypothetical protein